MYVFRRLVKFVLKMYDHEWFHGDIKPENIIMEPKHNRSEKNCY